MQSIVSIACDECKRYPLVTCNDCNSSSTSLAPALSVSVSFVYLHVLVIWFVLCVSRCWTDRWKRMQMNVPRGWLVAEMISALRDANSSTNSKPSLTNWKRPWDACGIWNALPVHPSVLPARPGTSIRTPLFFKISVSPFPSLPIPRYVLVSNTTIDAFLIHSFFGYHVGGGKRVFKKRPNSEHHRTHLQSS